MHTFHSSQPFALESGSTLPELTIGYYTYGTLNAEKNNVIWICHALTGSAAAAEWWDGLVGKRKLLDPDRYFLVCANMLGSCYGTTGPASNNPETGAAYGKDFPLVTVRDMVRAHQLLQAELGIDRIKLAIGGSMGGQQVLEWAISDPGLFEKICILATNAFHSPWGIAFNEAQRMAIEADASLEEGGPKAGKRGLEAARAIGMLSYRNYQTFLETQADLSKDKLENFRASSYQRYQGGKLQQRFNVYSYLILSKAMDSHNISRGRSEPEEVLRSIQAKALVIGIQSDVLFPVGEQILIANHIPDARLEIIESPYGHDGFLIEFERLGQLLDPFLNDSTYSSQAGKYKFRERANMNSKALPGTESF